MAKDSLQIEQTIAGGDEENEDMVIMGALYAQNTIIIDEGVRSIAGTLVANSIDLGSEIPHIYQVPTLKDSLPAGMISVNPFIVVERISWRKI